MSTGEVITSENENEHILKFIGETSLELKPTSQASRTGFVSFLSPPLASSMFSASLNLDDYTSLHLKLKTNRKVTLNLYPDSYIKNEIYQGYILPSSETQVLELPFEMFMLTKEGRVSEFQRRIDGILRLRNLGILVADGNGKKRFYT